MIDNPPQDYSKLIKLKHNKYGKTKQQEKQKNIHQQNNEIQQQQQKNNSQTTEQLVVSSDSFESRISSSSAHFVDSSKSSSDKHSNKSLTKPLTKPPSTLNRSYTARGLLTSISELTSSKSNKTVNNIEKQQINTEPEIPMEEKMLSAIYHSIQKGAIEKLKSCFDACDADHR